MIQFLYARWTYVKSRRCTRCRFYKSHNPARFNPTEMVLGYLNVLTFHISLSQNHRQNLFVRFSNAFLPHYVCFFSAQQNNNNFSGTLRFGSECLSVEDHPVVKH